MEPLTYIEIQPSQPPIGSVIWLHGLGADGHDFANLLPELQLPDHLALRFIFPHAPIRPITINNGHSLRAWYDIVSYELDQRADKTGLFTSISQVNALIEKEEALGIPTEKILLAGFSQGAVVALTTGLQYPKRLAGILALSGYFPHAQEILAKASTANQSIPIFIAHGTEDPIVRFTLGQSMYALLQEHHYSVTWHSYRMPHSVCDKEVRDISNWLQQIFSSQ